MRELRVGGPGKAQALPATSVVVDGGRLDVGTNLSALRQTPFLDRVATFVPLPGHEEAVARLVYAIETRDRLSVLSGPPGVGKSRVLAQALHETRAPLRRVSMVNSPMDRADLFAGLARGLGIRQVQHSTGLADGWHLLQRGIRVFAHQRFQAVLVVENAHFLVESGKNGDLERLVHLGEFADGVVTVLLVTSGEVTPENLVSGLRTLCIRLKPLTRSEAGTYLAAKLAATGCDGNLFSPRAVTRLHALSGGIPSGLDRLATLAMMAGASTGMESISAEVVDAVSEEFQQTPQAVLHMRFSDS
jgi:type II secretory pathway predicted ATPase ExeA